MRNSPKTDHCPTGSGRSKTRNKVEHAQRDVIREQKQVVSEHEEVKHQQQILIEKRDAEIAVLRSAVERLELTKKHLNGVISDQEQTIRDQLKLIQRQALLVAESFVEVPLAKNGTRVTKPK